MELIDLRDYIGQDVEICGKEYDYWGRLSWADENGVLLEDEKSIFVPWTEIIYLTEKSGISEEYKRLERNEKYRAMLLNLLVIIGGIGIGLLVRWLS